MTSEKVKQYIEEHSFCPELLFREWDPFLDLLYAEGDTISAICWWDHCRKSEQREPVGAGGYADPDDPEYMYAETRLCAENLETRTADEVKEYIARERETGFRYGSEYRSHDLVPSFEMRNAKELFSRWQESRLPFKEGMKCQQLAKREPARDANERLRIGYMSRTSLRERKSRPCTISTSDAG